MKETKHGCTILLPVTESSYLIWWCTCWRTSWFSVSESSPWS